MYDTLAASRSWLPSAGLHPLLKKLKEGKKNTPRVYRESMTTPLLVLNLIKVRSRNYLLKISLDITSKLVS